MSATPARLRAFYKNWYRPDLQAVVAVGDFDPAAIEAQIKKHFSGIPKPVNPPKRDVRRRSGQQGAAHRDRVGQGSDELRRRARCSSSRSRRRRPSPTIAAISWSGSTSGCSTAASTRSRRSRTRRSSAPAHRRATSSDATTDAFTLGAGVKDGGIERGLEALLTEAKRVDQFGFLQSELDREKQSLLRGYERAYAERDKTQSAALVRRVTSTTILRRRSDSGHRVRVQARAAARADDHARRRQQAREQVDHRRESRDHRAVAGEGRA